MRTNLCGQTDALALTARQGGRLAIEGKVVETDIQQEIESGTYLLEYFGSYLLLLGVELGCRCWLFQVVEPLAEFAEVHRGKFGDVLVPDAVGERLAVEPLSVAFGALAFSQKLVCPFLSTGTLVVVHHVAQIFHHTVERYEIVARRMHQFLVDADGFQRTVQYLVERLVRNIVDGRLQVATVFLQDGINLPENHLILVFPQRGNGTVVDVQLAVGNHFLQVNLVDITQSLATWASPLG